MAYTERYYHDYCNPRGEPCRLSLLEWEYTGDPEEVEAAVYPFMKSLDNSAGLKVGGVYPTVGTATFVATDTFDMELLYTADETKYRILHTVDGVQDWVGNVIPNGFYEDRHGENRHMVITASDRLPVLQGKLFTDTDGTNYGVSDGVFRRSFLWAIKEALKKTELLLPIWTLVDVMPQRDTSSVTLSRYVRLISPDKVEFADDDGSVGGMLEQGARITVDFGGGDTHVYTADTWTGYALWPNWVISITVEETVNTRLGNATVYISNPIDPGLLDDPLVAATHDVRTWINEADETDGQNYFQQRQTAKSAWEVLDAIARQWNARICLNGDHWEVLRWNVFKVTDGEYEWFRYNSEGTLIGRTPFGSTLEIPCHNTTGLYELYGSQKAMDRVLKGVNVNYRFKYKVDGDSLINLIRNGNFLPPGFLQTDPRTNTPSDWKRANLVTVWQQPPYMDLEYALQPIIDGPPGISNYISLSGVFHPRLYLSSYTGYPTAVNANSEINISWWQSSEWVSASPAGLSSPVWLCLRIILLNPADPSDFYMLVNAGPVQIRGENSVKWEKYTGTLYHLMSGDDAVLGGPTSGMSGWINPTMKTPPCPISGNLIFEIVGAAAPFAVGMYDGPRFHSVRWFQPLQGGGGTAPGMTRYLTNKTVSLSGVFATQIVDTSDEAVPQIHGYTYPSPTDQRTRNYTDTIPDIEILTGDDGDPDHVGNIYIGNAYATKWDTWAMEYGWSALGLLLAKSVMEQYWVPWRMITGTFSAHGITWSTRFMLEDRPGEVYAILRGALNAEDDTFTGTLVQVWDDDAPPLLPPGGSDGGNTTDPQWTRTDTTRCMRDSNAENTGHVEVLETDTNPASPTYGQERWVDIGEDTDACPIGEPIDLYWGEQETLDVGSLNYFPYVKDGDAYTVTYNGDDSDKVLRLLHRSSMGTVQSILYAGNYESISGWQYGADVTVNGYTYKHLYLTWPVGVFSDLPVIFVIN